MGIGIFIKNIAPLSLYIAGLISAFAALSGKVKWALYLAVFLIPLRNVIEKIQIYPLGNQFIDILLLGVLIGCFVNSNSKANKLIQSTRINNIAIILSVYLLFSVFRGSIFLYGNIIFDIHESRIQDWKNFILMPFIFFLVVNSLRNKSEVWSLFTVMCFSMFIANYYTFNQIQDHSSLISREKISGTFQFLGPNEVAAFFNEYTIILISVLYGLKNKRNKILLFLLILANSYSILFLYSRGAYAGLILGLFILFLIKDKKLLIPLILILCLWSVILPQKVVDRVLETKTESGELDESSQRRIEIWDQALSLFKSNPVVGIGYGSFRHLGLLLGDTHNIYVKILTEQGLVGLIIFLLTILSFIQESYNLYQKGDDELGRSLGLGFLCCIFVLMVNNFFGDRWSYLEPNTYVWVFAGLVAKLNLFSGTTETSSPIQPQKRNRKIRYYDI